ncbi:hypothetical protein B296_00026379 [Ensete ventricosum]|uniref:Uncharacterized protein n=1 Tax=Ensete ventricosum TaxID=4639 RepID=A0A426XTE8_ENSVE|nr:hypothetical protein B296_00026379 [Ensete ventricosum]
MPSSPSSLASSPDPIALPLPQPSPDPAASFSSRPPSYLLLNHNRSHFQPAIPLPNRCSSRALLTFLPHFLARPYHSPADAALVGHRCLLLFPVASVAAKPLFTAAKPSSAFSSLGRLFLRRPPLFLSSLPPPPAIPASSLLPLCFPSHLPLRPTQTITVIDAALLAIAASSSSTPSKICNRSPLSHNNVTTATTVGSNRPTSCPQLQPSPATIIASSFAAAVFQPSTASPLSILPPRCTIEGCSHPPLLLQSPPTAPPSSSSLCYNRIYRIHLHHVVAT